jgi:hypothetical protein
MRRIGKVGKANLAANRKLKKMFEEKGITTCELAFPGCLWDYMLGFAHKDRREAYRGNLARLGAFEEVLLSCVHCHEILDNRSKTTKKQSDAIFRQRR